MITGTGGNTLIVKVALHVPLTLFALIVGLKEPVTVGVPLINPVLALTLKPLGNPLAP